MGCSACHNGVRKDSPSHTRSRESCRWYDIEPIHYECLACKIDRQRSDPGHDAYRHQFGKCRFAPKPIEHPPRTGARPRDPRPTTSEHPTADASAVEAEPFNDEVKGGDVLGDVHGDVQAAPGRPSGSTDSYQRERRTTADAGTGTAKLPDWSRFNIQISLRNLTSLNPAVLQKELRKLHLRWWHAKEPKMRRLLQAAGIE